MIAPFEASRLKLDRAAKHLQELGAAVDAYLATRPCVIVAENFPGMELSYASDAWIARIRQPIPLHLSAIIGDVVHNLRTALDLLVCDLTRVNGKNPDDVYFPFCASPAELPGMLRKRNVYRAGADIAQAIESMKPYKGGNVALRAIHDMDVADKHQALLLVIGAATLPLGALLGRALPPAVHNFSTLITKDGQIVIGLPRTLSPPLGTELPARFFLAFDNPGFGNRPVIESLHEFAETANGVFKTLTALRPGAAFPSSPTH